RAAARAMLEKCRTYVFVWMEAAAVEAAMLVGPDLTIDASQALTATRCRFTDRERRAKCRVLKELGRAFHAVHDFYSHSNWTDPPRETVTLKTPPGLGHGEPAPWLESLDAAFPEGLISGCYEPILPVRDCAGRVLHRDMNKDTAEDPNSADGNYRRAIDVATEDTRRRWARFETRLIELYGAERGTRIACVVRNDDPAVCEQQA
ncbi:MAG: hypothetical protein Q7U20_09845, partial [Caulobacter sp.]|nr:hypothetical protein [Caulobacter sp.]